MPGFTTEIQRFPNYDTSLSTTAHTEQEAVLSTFENEKIMKILRVKRVLAISSKYRVKGLSSAPMLMFYCMWHVDYCT